MYVLGRKPVEVLHAHQKKYGSMNMLLISMIPPFGDNIEEICGETYFVIYFLIGIFLLCNCYQEI